MKSLSWLVFACAIGMACLAAAAQGPLLLYGHTGEVRTFNTKAFTDFGGTPTETYTANGMTFRLFYDDVRSHSGIGFDGSTNGATARQRIRDVLDELSASIHETGTLDVDFEPSQTDGGGFLAVAGSFWSLTTGFQPPSSLTRVMTGSKPFSTFPEIDVTVDFGFNYNFTSGATTMSQVDFFSVLLHEFTHGLGFATSAGPNGASIFATNVRTTYDEWMVKGQGGTNLFNPSGAFLGASADLISDNLFFEGTHAVAGYGQSVQPGIFAPNGLTNPDYHDTDGTLDGFIQGSSLSHWNTGHIVGGAVMEHVIVAGTDRRHYSGVDIGALVDIGWTHAAAPPGEGETEGATEGSTEGATEPTTVSITAHNPTFIEEGDPISLEAVVENGTALTYQWIKGSQDIPSENGATFIRNSAQQSDQASYRVRITTSAKATITSDAVVVYVAPVGGLPASGGLGLAAIAAACAFAGGVGLRKRK